MELLEFLEPLEQEEPLLIWPVSCRWATGVLGCVKLLFQAGQQLAQQMQQSNPELVEQLRRQMGGEAGVTTAGRVAL